MISFLKRKLDVIQRIGEVSVIPTFVSTGILLAFVFIPFLREFFEKRSDAVFWLISPFFLSAGTLFATKFGLSVMITGRAKQSVIPGVFEPEIPDFLARIFGFFYFLFGSIALLIGSILLVFAIFHLF
ncbi:hypothetical protein [Leptospira adleri]|uniref:Uncharacterized protein n=1 Tax=Leptospira adleri TaxID=2023186 RepID=A0A2M9YL63_9LEPT|nr:hypothetical protein [Leptospira adleri]PJZ52244.1 hypothetical protein CH380_16460 [Leptospira adleri]PJZ59692.1 hypothetical protein CH376_22355 [Leptospira adleri]